MVLALVARLDDEDPERDSGLLDSIDLAGDEGFGKDREALEHVRHSRVGRGGHRSRTSPAAPTISRTRSCQFGACARKGWVALQRIAVERYQSVASGVPP